MDYRRHYERLIERARDRTLCGYTERHHVLPKCLGGDDSIVNVVRLTPEEHYVAHQMLVKIHPGNHRLLWAAIAMTNGTTKRPRRNNKLYGWLRRKLACTLSILNAGRFVSDETRAKQRAAKLGIKRGPHSPETKAKMSAASKGKSKSESHRKALAAAKLGKKRKPIAEWHKQKLVEAARLCDRSYQLTDAYRRLQSQRSREAWAKRKRQQLDRQSLMLSGG